MLWDGYVNADKVDENGKLLPQYAICVDNDAAQVVNADLGNGSKNIVVGDAQHRCTHEKLPAVQLAAPLS